MMREHKIYSAPSHIAQSTRLNEQQYKTLYERSITSPSEFWADQAQQFITWDSPWDKVSQGDFENTPIQWFVNGKLNACYNCVDRHLEKRSDQIALIWEGNHPSESLKFTYGELHEKVCQLANVLKNIGIQKGSSVCLYLPMIPEAVIAMLACARIGAVHSVVFGGFSPEALKTRLLDAECELLITADEGIRGSKTIPLKQQADKALKACPNVKNTIVVKRSGGTVAWDNKRDIWYHKAIAKADNDCPVEVLDSSDPLFILYTSGSTGKPKGVLHSNGRYMVYAAMTYRYVFDYQEGDIYWCTADVGWITGHTYLVYGPLANGATTVLFEGVPHYPDFSRFWQIIDKHQVNIFYTAPTAIRSLRREGDEWVKRTRRTSLKLLGTVGEPINPDVWEWYYEVVGDSRCPIVDTWWQTETGGIMLTPMPGATPLVPGSAAWPFFGVIPDIVDDNGQSVPANQSGKLVIKQPWPGLMQTIYGDHQRFISTYLKEVPGCYFTGDRAFRDEKGYYWITGRNDDVIKVSGHRIGSEELESAFLSHHSVSEAAVVGVPDEITGEKIYAFISTKASIKADDKLKEDLITLVREEVGSFAKPDTIQWAPTLPKTRSGKIMRRILRKIARNELNELGDTSTLAEPEVINQLVAARKD